MSEEPDEPEALPPSAAQMVTRMPELSQTPPLGPSAYATGTSAATKGTSAAAVVAAGFIMTGVWFSAAGRAVRNDQHSHPRAIL
uniref:hypothetical protein n=1 Tax=Streptomyces sp. NRRL S-325 TaxID=1463899 RepID=UPI0005682BA5|nr:hypothetical protein [Streptomyces sp. NRRL S-325]